MFFVFGHHVRPYGKIGRTISKFGRTMSDDRQLFPALSGGPFVINIQQDMNLCVNSRLNSCMG